VQSTAFNQGCHGLVPLNELDVRYFRYQLLSLGDVLRSNGQGSTFLELSSDALASTSVLLPPRHMQRAIADYLDAETARIDALIDKKQRLARLLDEKESAVREAGVVRARAIFDLVPVKYLVAEIDTRLGEREPPELLSVSIHLGVVSRALMTDKEPRADELSSYKTCQTGDIVLNRMRAFQGGVGRAPMTGIVSPEYTILRPHPGVDSNFLEHIFRSPWFIGEMTARLRGIGNSEQGNVRTPRINFAELGMIRVPLPPFGTQIELAAESKHRSLTTRRAIGSLTSQIDLLSECRQALITGAVTGQIDIPGVAA
jgi:type I restriction enzyme S subunit